MKPKCDYRGEVYADNVDEEKEYRPENPFILPLPGSIPAAANGGISETATMTPIRDVEPPEVNERAAAVPDEKASTMSPRLATVRLVIS